MKRFLLTALFALASIGTANAEVRYFVDDTSDILKTLVTDDDLTAPTGETAVTKTVIETACGCSVYLGGTWDGTTYTPPTGITIAIDDTTDIGAVQASCSAMLDVFEVALAYIHDNRAAWPEDARAKAETGISWQIINSARVALNATRTHARRQKFCEESASVAGRHERQCPGVPRRGRCKTGPPRRRIGLGSCRRPIRTRGPTRLTRRRGSTTPPMSRTRPAPTS